MNARGWALLAGTLALAACGDRAVPAADFGARLFSDPTLSPSPFNRFSCATCHVVDPAGPPVVPGRLDPGYNLAGSVGRQGWWGGYETRLLDAMNVCVDQFMGGRKLLVSDDSAREIYAYLQAAGSDAGIAPGLPLTVLRDVTDLADLTGNAERGHDVYVRACFRCHGQPHTGAGRLGTKPSIIPEDSIKVFPDQARAVVVEKIRHGKFFSIGGVMPLYSTEALSDAQVADILAYVGL